MTNDRLQVTQPTRGNRLRDGRPRLRGGLPARVAFALLALALAAAGCGGDDGDEAPAAQPAEEAPAVVPDEEASAAEEAPAEAPADEPDGEPMESPGEVMNFPPGVDVNGDGLITIGHVVAGDRNDGGFYQGQVEAVVAFAEANGHASIVVDQVNPGAAREAFENLARQGVDLIIGGGSELRDGFIPVSEDPTFSDINFILVAGFPPTSDGYATAAASENEAHFMGGVAAGLLLERTGGITACITAGPELDFVKNMAASMNAGLAHLQDNYGQAAGAEMLVTYTGDFEDASLAQEAATAQLNQGCEVIYPYLGGALPAVWGTAAEAGVGVMATSMNLCGVPDLPFMTMSIMYNPALYLGDIISSYLSGGLNEGELLAIYGVGSGTGVGAAICDASADEQSILDEVRAAISGGEIDVNALIGSQIAG